MRSLVFDIGNTQIKMGVFDGIKLVNKWRMTTAAQKTSDEYGIDICTLLDIGRIPPESIEQVAIASVVPNVMYSFTSAIRRYVGLEPLVIGPGVRTGVKVKAANPSEVGADLMADVAAAIDKYGYPCLVVDFGTVTKYEMIDSEGVYMAAVFAPGLGASARSLTESTAQLPSIEIRKPRHILTANTIECMQAGVVYGYIGQVNYIIEQIKKESGLKDLKVVVTGGFGRMMSGEISGITAYDPNLTLEGVRLIGERNFKSGRSGKNLTGNNAAGKDESGKNPAEKSHADVVDSL